MPADCNGDFTVKAGSGILVNVETNGIKITNATDPGALEAGQNIELTPSGDHLVIGTTDDINVAEDLSVAGDSALSGDLSVAGNSTLSGNLSVAVDLSVTGDSALTGDLSVAGDSTLNGDLSVNGNIYNQGASYESHMEQVYTNNDYIVMRDNAVTGLSTGQYSGFQVKKYDGTNDGRLVIDSAGTARVGDVGDEQPLLTREESADLTDGALLKWDSANSKAVDEGTVGNDTKPVKIVNGVATPVTNDLQVQLTPQIIASSPGVQVVRYGKVIQVTVSGLTTGTGTLISNVPSPKGYSLSIVVNSIGQQVGFINIDSGNTSVGVTVSTTSTIYGSLVYITDN